VPSIIHILEWLNPNSHLDPPPVIEGDEALHHMACSQYRYQLSRVAATERTRIAANPGEQRNRRHCYARASTGFCAAINAVRVQASIRFGLAVPIASATGSSPCEPWRWSTLLAGVIPL
jgi:hypothetical protein